MTSASNKFFACVALVLSVDLGFAAHAVAATSSEVSATKPSMTYGQIVKETRLPKGNADKITSGLVGRRVRFTLKPFSQGQGAFYVNKDDRIGFVCKSMDRGFKGGRIDAAIVQHEAGADDGEFFTLDHCSVAK